MVHNSAQRSEWRLDSGVSLPFPSRDKDAIHIAINTSTNNCTSRPSAQVFPFMSAAAMSSGAFGNLGRTNCAQTLYLLRPQ